MSLFRSAALILDEGKLPSTYQEVEWIASDTNQWIDTLYRPNIDTELIIDFQDTSTSSWENYFGADNIYRCQRYTTYQSQFSWIPDGSTAFFNINLSTRIKLKFNKNGIFYEDGTALLNKTISGVSPNQNLVLFNSYYQSTLDMGAAYTLYRFQIKENDVLIKDFIPCYRKSDNEIGLYDLVNGQFHTNLGSYSFTKGNDVN